MRHEYITIGSRLVILASAMAVVWLNTHYLGTGGQGTASLISFGILLIVTLSGFIGGGALVYLHSRMEQGAVFLPSVVWAMCSALCFYLVFLRLPIVPQPFIFHVCVLGFMQAVFGFFMQLLLAAQRLVRYNVVVSLQVLVVPLALAFFYRQAAEPSAMHFVWALYLSFGFTLLLTAFSGMGYVQLSFTSFTRAIRQLWSMGRYAQGANVMHLLNQRLNYVLVDNLAVAARYQTGLLSLAMYAAEAVWTVAKSLSVVQYAVSANTEDVQLKQRLNQRNALWSFLIALMASVGIVLLPDGFYTWLLRSDAVGLRPVLLALIPALLANSQCIIYASWFSGHGLYKVNFGASAIALLPGIALAWLLIPAHGAVGGAWAVSAVFVCQLIYMRIALSRHQRLVTKAH